MFNKEKKEKKEKRFFVKDSQGIGLGGVQILVDKVTGVNYLMTIDQYTITPLLDENGKVIVDKSEENKEAEIW